jgi:uncharacterized UPF0160 family protein
MNGQLLSPEFRGLNTQTLAQKGYRGTFTHKAGFTGILESKDDVVKLCLASI